MLSTDTWNTSNEAINILGKDKYPHLWNDSEVPMRSADAYGGRGTLIICDYLKCPQFS